MIDDQQHAADDQQLEIEEIIDEFIDASPQEEQNIIAAHPDILLADGVLSALHDYISGLEQKLSMLEDARAANPGLQTPQQPSRAETEAMLASMTTQQFEQMIQMFGKLSNDEITQLLRTMSESEQLSGMQINVLHSVLQQHRNMSPEDIQQLAEQMKAFSPEQIHTAGDTFKAAAETIGATQVEQATQKIKNMSKIEQEALIEDMLKKGQIDEGQKDLMLLSLQQLSSAGDDQLKELLDVTLKARLTGGPVDSDRLLKVQIPVLQNTLSATQEPESAIEAYTQELATLSREQNPFHWARTHWQRGGAYLVSKVGEQSDNIERALEDFNTALTVFTPETSTIEWGIIRMLRAAIYITRQKGHFAENRQKAVEDCEAAMHIFSRETFPKEWASAKLQRAVAYNALAEFTGDHGTLPEKAILDCNDALSIFTYQQQPEEWMRALSTRCSAHGQCDTGNLQEHKEQVIIDANAVLAVISKEKDPDDWAMLHAQRATAYWQRIAGNKQQNLEQAMADYEVALEIYSLKDSPQQRAIILSNRAMVRMEFGHGDLRAHIEQSIHDLHDAIDVLQKETQPWEWAAAQLSCAVLYLKRMAGDHDQNLHLAYQRCNLALEIFDKERTPILWGQTLVRRGLARYGELPGELQQVLENRMGVMQFVINGPNTVLELVKSSYEVFRASYDDFDMALTVLTKENAPAEWALAHSARARAYEHMDPRNSGVYRQQVSEDYEMAQTVFTPESKPFEWAAMQTGQAARLLLSITHQTPEALKEKAQKSLKYTEAALRVYTAEISTRSYLYARVLQAIAYGRMSNWEKAHGSWLEARKVRRTTMATALHEQSRTDQDIVLMNINIYKHDAQVLLRCTPPDVTAAVIALEEGRAQGLRLAFDLDSLDPKKIENPQAKKRAATLLAAREAWRQCQQQVEQLENIVELSEKRHQYIQALQRAHDAFVQATEAIRAHDNPDFLSPAPTLASIAQAVSAPGDALVYLVAGSYFGLGITDNIFGGGADKGFAIIVTRDAEGEPHVHALDLPLLTGFALDGLFPLETTPNSRVAIDLDLVITQAGKLGMNDLVTTLREWGIRRITFIPYGRLSMFPLAAIQVQRSNGEKAYLGDLFEVSIAPSARSYAISKQRASEGMRKRQRQGLCLVGNPSPLVDDIDELPQAEAETNIIWQIARAYGYPSTRIQHLSKKDATKQQVIEGLDMAQYAHLAMHGIYNVAKPLDSQLLLAGNRSVQVQERTITLGEILQGTIPLAGLRLLVLSACDTSLIDLRRLPDEVIGLAAGFLQAGVAGVIASLWRVDDTATYLLMVRFARHYLDPQGIWSPVRALAEAQRWLREVATNRVLSTYDPLEDLPVSSMMPEEALTLHNRTLLEIRKQAKKQLETAPDACPYANPKYWAAFMVTGC